MDVLDLGSKGKVVLAIDYFSRYMFGEVIGFKSVHKIIRFLKKVHSKIKFQKLLTDNGREFANKAVDLWCQNNQVIHKKSIPYYHKSNGRIERANRTIRKAMAKTKGKINTRLANVLKNYNGCFHRGIGMSPAEALDPLNFNRVRNHSVRYEKEFVKKDYQEEKIPDGSKVLIKNEPKKDKESANFNKTETMLKNVYGDIYEVAMSNGLITKRHISQLKCF